MTDKERAQERRALANELRAQYNYIGADYLDRRADEIDPPEPEIPTGTLVTATHNRNGGYVYGEWRNESKSIKNGVAAIPKEVLSNIKPLRTLAPGQVAVDRDDASRLIRHLKTQGWFGWVDYLQAVLNRDTEAER